MLRLWEVNGRTKGGSPVRIRVRATDYYEARSKALKTRMIIRDIVLMDGPRRGNPIITVGDLRQGTDSR